MKKLWYRLCEPFKKIGIYFQKKRSNEKTKALPETPPQTPKKGWREKLQVFKASTQSAGWKKFLGKTWQGSQKIQQKVLKTKGGKKLFSFVSHIQWKDLPMALLAAANRPHVHRYFIILLLTLSAYQSGKLLGLFLTGDEIKNFKPDIKTLPKTFNYSQSQLNKIKQRNIFDLKEAEFTPQSPQLANQSKKKIDNSPCTKAKRSSSLPIKLMQTIVLQDSVKSLAAVQIRSNSEIEQFREGEEVEKMAKIGRIGRLEVIFRNLKNGQCEKISNQDPLTQSQSALNVVSPQVGKKLLQKQTKTGVQNKGNEFTIPRKTIADKLKNINEVLTQAKAIKIDNGDGSLSFKMTEIVPGSIFTELGFKNGDIIRSINGEKIKNLNEVFGLFGNIKNMNDLELNISRNGLDSKFQYKITQ